MGDVINIIMVRVSIMRMFVYKEVTSNDTIISSSSMGTFLMELENVVEFLALLFSSLRMLAMYLLRLYSEEPLYETIGRIGTPGLWIFG